MKLQRAILTFAATLVTLAIAATTASGAHPPAATAPADAAPVVRLYDTGKPSDRQLTPEQLKQRTGWKEVADGDLVHAFAGDPVFLNDQLAVVIRPHSFVDVYSIATGKRRAGLAPDNPYAGYAAFLSGIRTVQNSSSAVVVEANYDKGGILRLRLSAGAFHLEAGRDTPREGSGTLWVVHEGNYVVAPDFFGDDLVYGGLSRKYRNLPADNSFLALADGGEAIVACVWSQSSGRERTVVSPCGLSGRESAQLVGLPKGKSIWLAVFEGKNTWRECAIEANGAGRPVALDWKPPFAAKWRASLAAGDDSARSWNLRDSAAEITPPAGRQKLVVYPIDRSAATPLTTYCLTDLMRDALGVGPCQYVLDAEGLGAAEAATPEQVARWLERELAKKPARRDGDAIKQRLFAMKAHCFRMHGRLSVYCRFAEDAIWVLRSAEVTDSTGLLSAAAGVVQEMVPNTPSTSPKDESAAAFLEIESQADRITKFMEDETALEKSRDALSAIRAAGARQDHALARMRMGMRQLEAIWPPTATTSAPATQGSRLSPVAKARLRIERLIETLGLSPASQPAGR